MKKNRGLKTAIIHQPHFLPWLGYFNKLANCDIFINQDNVQFRRRYFQNRTKIQNTQKRPIWFTVPINANRSTQIQDVKIAENSWGIRFVKTILHSYRKEPFFKENFDFINELIRKNDNTVFLSELNINLIFSLSEYLNINYNLEYAHHYEKHLTPTDDLVNICRKNNVKRYLFGEGGGKEYHGISSFKKNGIKTVQQNFMKKFIDINNDIYPSGYEMSVIHYLFAIGKKNTEKIIKKTWRIKTAYNTDL